MKLPSRLLLALKFLLACGLLHIPPALARQPSQRKASPTQVKGTRVSLTPPEGFTEATRFSGFQQEETGASLMVTELPGPYTEVTTGFTAEGLTSRGMKLLSKKQVKVNGHKGLLLHVAQSASGVDFLKWLVVLGDASATLVVTATYREEDTKALGRPMQAAVLSTRWDRDAAPTAAPALFTLKETPGLKEAQRLQGAIIYTRDGTLPGKPGDEPFLIVAPSLGATAASEDVEAFSLARLKQTAAAEALTVESGAPLTVDGLTGHELVASAKDPATGRDFTLYQVMLVDAQGYYLLQGRVGGADRATYLGHFKTAARAFQRTPRP
ncbi:hypothetical protein [Pyxidicoccus xibeiensis]|uniref:hypothetical protein n=1 Tax=Pyxidicoccus xibeiensis TaxID=2906759 RepID=UPI0020A7D527|nr:hypothetical protein [Pyxidicoccus xibeiensis]MCP3136444.1 hypothetical protein [Pyxidicoccus xibeiensis]